MLKILINSYTCCPNMGSEQGMGWNWIVHLAKHCELFVITEGEYKNQIEEWITVPEHVDMARNIHFHFNPVTKRIRKMCWRQGDWRFYKYYKDWQKRTAELARDICSSKHIDILHQLNMIGFREPGYLWQVSRETGIPFVWGPIGGLKQFPIAYVQGGTLIMGIFLRLKNFLNIWQLKHDKRVDNAFKQASLLISSIPDSYQAIKTYKGRESVVIPETGTFIQMKQSNTLKRFHKEVFTILWVGKFDFRKRLDIALNATALASKSANVVLKVFGTGSEKQRTKGISIVKRLGIEDKIEWMGNLPNEQVKKAMGQADLFFFSSVDEDTSTVVLEAISNQLPVLCFNTCGMSAIVNDDVGIKIPLTTPDESEKEFAEKILYLYHHRNVLETMSENCRLQALELSWDAKAERMANLYDEVIRNNKRK